LIAAARHKANTIGPEHLRIAIKQVPVAQEKVALPTS
jgi:hypothetical protein